ncbi:GFA family protein [Aspergillus novofumigatus IBT 16806]|uniref:CENP-V/GFA domain-containing protein n=1 Tax=Aspergillus novofumigatus (strain IBT 16806) TaxID=1392255 RepID=A0A2I1C0R2_ASPN1|nr:uncharacterized protein P174DRAFT_412478 [Aspergillus novofumigatus IBT 16806]PKX91230.1 hypothetical protein P174DRAFT_412478 [Aspergillus novofumigatus IBT 16806]
MAQSKNADNKESIDLPTQIIYEGSCHCKAASFSVKLPSLLSQLTVISCNCSYCHIAGSLLTFVGDVEIYQGASSLKEYRFGSHSIQIFFCGTCGANVYNKSLNPKFRYGEHAVNVRLLHGIDLETIEITKADGKRVQLPPLGEGPL